MIQRNQRLLPNPKKDYSIYITYVGYSDLPGNQNYAKSTAKCEFDKFDGKCPVKVDCPIKKNAPDRI